MRTYTPRRQSTTRWLDGDCPAGVLAIYDAGPDEFERYTVFYTEPVAGTTYADMVIGYRGMSEHPAAPNGFGVFGDMPAHEVSALRVRWSHRACRWTALPPDVQACVRRDVAKLGTL